MFKSPILPVLAFAAMATIAETVFQVPFPVIAGIVATAALAIIFWLAFFSSPAS